MSILHINRGNYVERGIVHLGAKWCFGCRKHLQHTAHLMCDEPLDGEPSWYEPHWAIRCERCHHDRTCFPGTYREG